MAASNFAVEQRQSEKPTRTKQPVLLVVLHLPEYQDIYISIVLYAVFNDCLHVRRKVSVLILWSTKSDHVTS